MLFLNSITGVKGTAWTLVMRHETAFAGRLVEHLQAASQPVSDTLLYVAEKDAKFRQRRPRWQEHGSFGRGRGMNAPESHWHRQQQGDPAFGRGRGRGQGGMGSGGPPRKRSGLGFGQQQSQQPTAQASPSQQTSRADAKRKVRLCVWGGGTGGVGCCFSQATFPVDAHTTRQLLPHPTPSQFMAGFTKSQ